MRRININTLQINTERLLNRRITHSDLIDLYEIYSDQKVMEFIDDPIFTSIEMMDEFYQSVLSGYKTEKFYELVILSNKNKPIGTCSIHSFNKNNQSCEIGYLLNRQYWKKGIMFEAITEVINYIIINLKIKVIKANVNPLNLNSINLLMKLGFKKLEDNNSWVKCLQ